MKPAREGQCQRRPIQRNDWLTANLQHLADHVLAPTFFELRAVQYDTLVSTTSTSQIMASKRICRPAGRTLFSLDVQSTRVRLSIPAQHHRLMHSSTTSPPPSAATPNTVSAEPSLKYRPSPTSIPSKIPASDPPPLRGLTASSPPTASTSPGQTTNASSSTN